MKNHIDNIWRRYHLWDRSGVAQLAERSAVNRIVVGSIPTPGAAEAGRAQRAVCFAVHGVRHRGDDAETLLARSMSRARMAVLSAAKSTVAK